MWYWSWVWCCDMRLSDRDQCALLLIFRAMDNAMLMEIIWLIENLVKNRRKDLTERRRYVNVPL